MAWTPLADAHGSMNGTTEATLLAAPGASAQRLNLGGRGKNVDTIRHTITFRKKLSTGPTYYDLVRIEVEKDDYFDIPEVALGDTDESFVGVMGEAAATTNPTWTIVPVEHT